MTSTARAFFYIGLTAGGPMAMWVSSLVYIIFAATSAATLAEICSSIPVSGSIYTWAAEAAFVSGERRNVVREQGKQTRPEEFARFVGYVTKPLRAWIKTWRTLNRIKGSLSLGGLQLDGW